MFKNCNMFCGELEGQVVRSDLDSCWREMRDIHGMLAFLGWDWAEVVTHFAREFFSVGIDS